MRISAMTTGPGGVAGHLELCPISLIEANEFVRQYHRHRRPVPGHKFSIGVSNGQKIIGVAIVGRPIARYLDDGWTLEVNRTCTDGTPNVNSMLYGACQRVTFGLGYKKLITYTLSTESGSSLKAVGWKCIGLKGGGNWNCKSRPRINTPDELRQKKLRWEVDSGPGPGPAIEVGGGKNE